jgi:hypothetical protein
MAHAAAKTSRARARARVQKPADSQLVVTGGRQTPPVFPLDVIRRALRHAELSISLQPSSPYNQDVLAFIDEARSAIRSLERLADSVAAQRMAATDTAQSVGELLDALGSPS